MPVTSATSVSLGVHHRFRRLGQTNGERVRDNLQKDDESTERLVTRGNTAELREKFKHGHGLRGIGSHALATMQSVTELDELADAAVLTETVTSYVAPNLTEDEKAHWGKIIKRCLQAGNVLVTAIVIANSIQIGACVNSDEGQEIDATCGYMQDFFNAAFLVEMVVKITVLGICGYFRSPWNWFDFVLVWIAVVGDWILPHIDRDNTRTTNYTLLRLFRMARIMRLSKVVRMKAELLCIVEGLTVSLHSIVWVALVLAAVIYVASVFCVQAFAVETEHFNSNLLGFDSVPRAAFTLFTVTILAEWMNVVGPVMERYPFSIVFFIVFIVITTFGILNLVVGVICEKTVSVKEEYMRKQEVKAQAERMSRCADLTQRMYSFTAETLAEPGRISKAELRDLFKSEDPAIREVLDELTGKMNLPYTMRSEDLHSAMDITGDGLLAEDEFLDGVLNLVFCDERQTRTLILTSIARLRQEFKLQHLAIEQTVKDEIADLRNTLRTGLRVRREKQPGTGSASPAANDTQSSAEQLPVGSDDKVNQFSREEKKSSVKACVKDASVGTDGGNWIAQRSKIVDASISPRLYSLEAELDQMQECFQRSVESLIKEGNHNKAPGLLTIGDNSSFQPCEFRATDTASRSASASREKPPATVMGQPTGSNDFKEAVNAEQVASAPDSNCNSPSRRLYQKTSHAGEPSRPEVDDSPPGDRRSPRPTATTSSGATSLEASDPAAQGIATAPSLSEVAPIDHSSVDTSSPLSETDEDFCL